MPTPDDDTTSPLLSRTANPDRLWAELRPKVVVEVVGVLDAVRARRAKRTGKSVSRDALVSEILTAWAREKHEESTVIVSVVGSNPFPSDSAEQ